MSKVKLLRRSRAAEMIGVVPATLRRWEINGVLQPVKLNARLTMYHEADVLKIVSGEVSTAPEARG